MGWGCTAKAGYRLSAIQDWTYAHGGLGSQNSWRDPKGNRYFFEVGREQRDGAITATIFKWVDDTHARRSGSLRIEPDGRGFRGPAILKNVLAYEIVVDGISMEWLAPQDGEEVTGDSLWNYLLLNSWSYYPGGINYGTSKALGY